MNNQVASLGQDQTLANHAKVKNREALVGRSRFYVQCSSSTVHPGSLPNVKTHNASFGRGQTPLITNKRFAIFHFGTAWSGGERTVNLEP